MDETYNGWANRETWAFYLHLSNDQGLWDLVGRRVAYALSILPDCRCPDCFVGSNVLEFVKDLWSECEGEEWVRLMRSDVGSVWRVDIDEVGSHLMGAWSDCVWV